MSLIVVLVGVAVVGLAVVAIVALVFRATVLEQYEAVVAACGVDREEFERELTARGSMQDAAAHYGVDCEEVVRQTVKHSRYRWLAALTSRD